MTEPKSMLGLITPDQLNPTKDSSDFRPKKIEQWIENLPLANIGETARQIYKRLTEANRLTLTDDNRVKINEHFQEPVQYLTTNLCKYFIDTTFPLSLKSRKIANLCNELNCEMSIAYKILIKDLLSKKISRSDKKNLLLAIYKTMRYSFNILSHTSIIYDPVPTNIWHETNRLYLFCEQNDQLNTAIDDNILKQKFTIQDIYKQIILMYLCSPNRLKQHEIKNLYNLVPTWIKHISIYKPEKSAPKATFIVHLGVDSPPVYTQIFRRELSNLCRFINMNTLIKILHDQLKNPPTDENKDIIKNFNKQIVLQLLHQWSNMRKRAAPRNKTDYDVEVAVSLSDIHNLLNQNTAVDSFNNPGGKKEPKDDWMNSSNKSVLLQDNASPFLADGLSLIPKANDMNVAPIDNQAIWSAPKQPASAIESITSPCKIIDESAGGYSLLWYTSNPPKVRIGELFGLKSENPSHHGLGILRWMKKNDDRGMLLGIQVVAQNCFAMMSYHTDKKENQSKGLILSIDQRVNTEKKIITTDSHCKKGSVLTLLVGKIISRVRLTRLVESTPLFKIYQYAELDSTNARIETTKTDDKDFDSVWSLL